MVGDHNWAADNEDGLEELQIADGRFDDDLGVNVMVSER